MRSIEITTVEEPAVKRRNQRRFVRFRSATGAPPEGLISSLSGVCGRSRCAQAQAVGWRDGFRTTALPSELLVGYLSPERLHEAFHVERGRLLVVQLTDHRDLRSSDQERGVSRVRVVSAGA